VNAEVSLHGRAVSCGATGDDAGGEAHSPSDVLFDFFEPAVSIDGRSAGGDELWLFAREIAAGVEGINADVEERTATREFPAETPLAGRDVETKTALDGPGRAHPGE